MFLIKTHKDVIGNLKAGDYIIGADKQPTLVTQVFQKHTPKSMYELTMNDGQTVKCSGNHLWYSETDIDRNEKRGYLRLAKYFFKHEKIPEYDPIMPAYPIEIIGHKFSNDEKSQRLIIRICESLGPSFSTPDVLFDGYIDLISEHNIYSYSYNDVIDFLKGLYKVVKKDKNQYFYFGRVRETRELVNMTHLNINIPEKGDILHGNK